MVSVSLPSGCRTCVRSASACGWRAARATSRRSRAASPTSSSTCSSRARRHAVAEDIAQTIDSIGGQMDAFTAKEYASYYFKVLDEHLPLAVEVLADIVMRPRVQRRRHRAREEGRPRRDQDGRGHARRPRPRAVHREFLAGPSARPADSRHEGDRRGADAGRASTLLRRHLLRAEPDRRGGRQHRARAGARSGHASVRRAADHQRAGHRGAAAGRARRP